ncbi:MAG: hypothetical protein ABIH34_06130 [Nanoarchaeota archaeon]
MDYGVSIKKHQANSIMLLQGFFRSDSDYWKSEIGSAYRMNKSNEQLVNALLSSDLGDYTPHSTVRYPLKKKDHVRKHKHFHNIELTDSTLMQLIYQLSLDGDSLFLNGDKPSSNKAARVIVYRLRDSQLDAFQEGMRKDIRATIKQLWLLDHLPAQEGGALSLDERAYTSGSNMNPFRGSINAKEWIKYMDHGLKELSLRIPHHAIISNNTMAYEACFPYADGNGIRRLGLSEFPLDIDPPKMVDFLDEYWDISMTGRPPDGLTLILQRAELTERMLHLPGTHGARAKSDHDIPHIEAFYKGKPLMLFTAQ